MGPSSRPPGKSTSLPRRQRPHGGDLAAARGLPARCRFRGRLGCRWDAGGRKARHGRPDAVIGHGPCTIAPGSGGRGPASGNPMPMSTTGDGAVHPPGARRRLSPACAPEALDRLAREAAGGDDEPFRALVLHTQQAVRLHLAARAPADLVEELVQSTYVEAWSALAGYQP